MWEYRGKDWFTKRYRKGHQQSIHGSHKCGRVTGTYFLFSSWTFILPHNIKLNLRASICALLLMPVTLNRIRAWKLFCVGAITMEITDAPLASPLLVHLYPIMPRASSHSVFVCVFRTLQALQPFSGSQLQVLWFSRETRGSTSSNGTKTVNQK